MGIKRDEKIKLIGSNFITWLFDTNTQMNKDDNRKRTIWVL